MLTTVRTSRRLAGKRKAPILDDLSEEDEPPKKKQKTTQKPAVAPKKKATKKRKEDSEESEEENSENNNNSKKKSEGGESDLDEDSDNENDWAELKPRKKSDLEDLKATALQKLLASADASAYQSLGEEEFTLPDELILQIFHGLTRKQLHAVGLTCRQWLRLTNDQSLGWHLAYSVVLQENLQQYYEVAMKNKGRYDASVLSRMPYDERKATLVEYKKTFLQEASIYGPPAIISIGSNSFDGRVQLLAEDGNAIVRYAKVVDNKVQLNHHKWWSISWSEINKDPELWAYRIHKATAEEAAQLSGYESYINSDTLVDQWIVDLEVNIKRLEELIAANEPVAAVAQIYALVEADFLHRLIDLSSAKFSSLPRRSFTAQQQPEGFKEEIKLYKYQLDAISWMKSVEDNKDGLPYFTAYPWRRAKTQLIFDLAQTEKQVVKELDKYVDVALPKGGVLADEMGLGKTMEMIGLMLASPSPEKLAKHRALISSRATLVLCPNHLVMQWSDELAKTTNLKVAVAATIVQLRQFTYQNFVDYDVVIASYQLLENPKYFFLESTEKKRTSIRDHEEAERSEWVESSLKALKRDKKGMAKKCPILEHFYWHRLVLDEGHEYLAKPYFNYLLSTCFSRFAWYVTGTPFPTHQHFKYVKRHIGVQSNFKEYPMQQETLLTDLMLRDLYWRHTKESVKGEYKIPTYVEDLVLIEFDEIEKALYADQRREADQSFMCGSLLQQSTLDQRLDRLLSDKKRSIEHSRDTHIPQVASSLAGAQRFYDNETDLFKKAVALTVLENRRQELIEAKESLEHHKKVLEIAQKVTPFANRDKMKFTELTKLIEQHGTKLVQMIVYLKKLFARKPDSRVIFFSQFEDTLTNVSQILSDNNIPNVFVEGNIWKRTKAITNFKTDDDVKVIMLSLKNAASGTNLVEATHVILMDPVTGSKKEAQAIESQAIGRAFRQGQTKQITIVRFVVKNTIEHALYLRNNDVNEDTTVVVSKDNKPQLVRSPSKLALKRSGSISNLREMTNNTNATEMTN